MLEGPAGLDKFKAAVKALGEDYQVGGRCG
jgi:hypothetical protein